MKKRKNVTCIALAALAIVAGVWSAPSVDADTCEWCEYVFVPDPDGNGGQIYATCIDFDTYYGWEECWEYGTTCALWVQCNENTDPG